MALAVTFCDVMPLPAVCFSTLSVTALLVAVLAVDLINLERRDTIWDYPAWRMALGVMAIVSLSLKVLAMKLVNCLCLSLVCMNAVSSKTFNSSKTREMTAKITKTKTLLSKEMIAKDTKTLTLLRSDC